MKAVMGKSPGKKCVGDIYEMNAATPETIAYAACMCRYILNTKGSWSSEDGNFNSPIFFQNILDLFEDEDWAKKTLAWWTK
jgi:hypothetical protein